MGRSGHESFETFQERCSGGVGDNFEVDRFCAEADEHAQVSFYNLWLTGVSSLELERSCIVKPKGALGVVLARGSCPIIWLWLLAVALLQVIQLRQTDRVRRLAPTMCSLLPVEDNKRLGPNIHVCEHIANEKV